ncbi:MAG TPA: hypothetical protein PLH57_07125 [Oligoflexia bacterium]|nr:hypothetical protein [Oligoflexia bacterium]
MAPNLVFSFSATILIIVSIFHIGCSPKEMYQKKIAPLFANKPEPSKEPSPEDIPLEHRAINGEFIRELFQVVLERSIASEDEFLRYMNVLDQGGHYEGIYNGVVYSAEFREKEKGNATVSSLKLFAEIMTQITLDQKYDPLRIYPSNDTSEDVPTIKDSNSSPQTPQPSPEERSALVEHFEKEGLTRSLYTLKRRLGEELLKTIDLKKEYREKLATWYGKFSVFLNSQGTDFGIPQRNVKNEYYHYKWGLQADEDRLKWECLNRIHRLMNRR